MGRCYKCMNEYDGDGACPFCGFEPGESSSEVYHLPPGTILNDRYSLGVVIGFGGFGTVYKAWDSMLERVVAVKEYYPTFFLRRDISSHVAEVYDKKNIEKYQKGKEEFLEEARNIAKYNTYPNIVHVYDYFEEYGTAYFVMEYLNGFTLKTYIQQATAQNKVFTVESALYVVNAVLNALEITHADGIIHRDIKPGNIHILPDGTVKLYDFGAARFSSEEALTRTVIITPGYAPPEQYDSKSKQGPSTDLYAVGAILYEMLTGVKPEESVNRKREDTLISPDKLNSKVPANVADITMRAMALQQEIRFQTAADFKKAIGSSKTKRVRSAKREIRHRKRKSFLRVFAFVLLALIILAVASLDYLKQYLETNIPDTSLTMWVSSSADDIEQTENMYGSMLSEFYTEYPQVELSLEVISEEEYLPRLLDALAQGKGPDLFDSTGLTTEQTDTYCEDLKRIFELSKFDRSLYYFFGKYESLFPGRKQIPLSFDMPILYKNVNYDKDIVSADFDSFMNGESNYVGTLGDYERVQENMAGIYEIGLPEDSEGVYDFGNLWSVNIDSDFERQYVAERVIYYLLSDNSQEVLTVQYFDGFPINRNVWNVFVEINPDFAVFSDHVDENYLQGE
ncbi:MAG: protein kinase [Lachnospiraceae bacterium]|nr:protein kinase [Lachnospiraceae bacterium]